MLGLPVRVGNNWLLNCCVSPQSEIARVRIDRSLIGAPCDFRHVGHLGAGDLISSIDDRNALGELLRSKGGPEYATAVPTSLRAGDVPIGAEKCTRQHQLMAKKMQKEGAEVEENAEKENGGEETGRRRKKQAVVALGGETSD